MQQVVSCFKIQFGSKRKELQKNPHLHVMVSKLYDISANKPLLYHINPLVTNINASTLETKHRLIFVIEQKHFRLTYNTTANIEHWWVGIGLQRNMIGWQHSSCTFVKLHLVFDLSNKIKSLSYTCILHIPVKITNKWSSNYFIFKFICFLKMLNSQKIKFWN